MSLPCNFDVSEWAAVKAAHLPMSVRRPRRRLSAPGWCAGWASWLQASRSGPSTSGSPGELHAPLGGPEPGLGIFRVSLTRPLPVSPRDRRWWPLNPPGAAPEHHPFCGRTTRRSCHPHRLQVAELPDSFHGQLAPVAGPFDPAGGVRLGGVRLSWVMTVAARAMVRPMTVSRAR